MESIRSFENEEITLPQRTAEKTLKQRFNKLITNLAFRDQFAQLETETRHLNNKFSFLGTKYFNNPQAYENLRKEWTELTEQNTVLNDEMHSAKTELKEINDRLDELDRFEEVGLLNSNDRLEQNKLILAGQKLGTRMLEIKRQQNELSENSLPTKIQFQKATDHQTEKMKIDQRKNELNQHLDEAKLSIGNKLGILWKTTAAKMHPLRTTIMGNLIHPSTKAFTQEKLSKDEELQTYFAEANQKIDELVKKGEVDRIKIHTEDHHQLDGCVFKASSPDRPTMVMVSGNLATAELIFESAQNYSKKHDINVLIYNPRGVVQSLGKERSTQQAVTDCEAATRYALKNFCQGDPQKLGVYGHSLGGGVSATALERMVEKGELPPGGIGFYVNSNSFSSLQGFLKGISATLIKNERVLNHLETIFQRTLQAIRLNTLDSEKAIKKGIAKQVIIFTADNDEVILKHGRLGERFTTSQTTSQKIEVIATPLFAPEGELAHNQDHQYLQNKKYNDLIDQWANPVNEQNVV